MCTRECPVITGVGRLVLDDKAKEPTVVDEEDIRVVTFSIAVEDVRIQRTMIGEQIRWEHSSVVSMSRRGQLDTALQKALQSLVNGGTPRVGYCCSGRLILVTVATKKKVDDPVRFVVGLGSRLNQARGESRHIQTHKNRR